MSYHPRQTQLTLPTAEPEYKKDNESISRRRIEQALKVISLRLDLLESVIENQQAAISNPAGGATVDAEARTAIIAILDAMRAHGLINT